MDRPSSTFHRQDFPLPTDKEGRLPKKECAYKSWESPNDCTELLHHTSQRYQLSYL